MNEHIVLFLHFSLRQDNYSKRAIAMLLIATYMVTKKPVRRNALLVNLRI